MSLDPRLPNAAALTAFLGSSDVPAPDGGFLPEDLAAAIGAAAELAEELTGWTPLLTAARSIQIPPPPGGSRPGEWPAAGRTKVRLASPVAGGITLSAAGAPAMTGNWSLGGALGLDGPYTLLTLFTQPRGALTLTGTIGRWATLPGPVMQALLKLAGAWFLSKRREGLLAEGLASWEEGGVKETRGYEMTTSLGEGWQGEAETTLARYARVQF